MFNFLITKNATVLGHLREGEEIKMYKSLQAISMLFLKWIFNKKNSVEVTANWKYLWKKSALKNWEFVMQFASTWNRRVFSDFAPFGKSSFDQSTSREAKN